MEDDRWRILLFFIKSNPRTIASNTWTLICFHFDYFFTMMRCASKSENSIEEIQPERNAIRNFYYFFYNLSCCFFFFSQIIYLFDFMLRYREGRLGWSLPGSSGSSCDHPLRSTLCYVDVGCAVCIACLIRNKNKFIFDLCNWLSSFAPVDLFHFPSHIHRHRGKFGPPIK